MIDYKEKDTKDKNEDPEKSFKCCGNVSMPEMIKTLFSNEDNLEDCQKMMQKMCGYMSDNPQK